MKIRSGAFLIALLLGSASSSLACNSGKISTQDTKTPPPEISSNYDSSASAGWKTYAFDKPLAFRMSLPIEPEQRISTFPGKTETSHLFISESNSGVYGAIYINDLPAVASSWGSTGNHFFYAVFVKDFAVKLGNKEGEKGIGFDSLVRFTTERQVLVSGREALERDFSVGDFQGRAQLVRIGKAGFCVIALWKQTARRSERDAFFNSVKITDIEL